MGAQAVAICPRGRPRRGRASVARPLQRVAPLTPAGRVAGRGRSRWPPLTQRRWRARSASRRRPEVVVAVVIRTCSTVSTMGAGDLDNDLRVRRRRDRGVATRTATSRAARSMVPIETLRHVLDVLGPPPEPDAPPPVYVLREGQDPWRHDLPRGAVVRLDGRRRMRAAGGAAGPAAARPARARAARPRGAADRRAAHRAPSGRPAGVGARGAAVRAAVGRAAGASATSATSPRLPAVDGASRASCCSRRCTRRRSTPPVQPSPYYASSRRARNPLHIAVEDGAGGGGAGRRRARRVRTRSRTEGRALSELPLIDRDAVLRVKEAALRIAFAAQTPDGRRRWRRSARRSPDADRFAAFTVLARRHGGDWRRWPAAYAIPPAPRWRGWRARRRARSPSTPGCSCWPTSSWRPSRRCGSASSPTSPSAPRPAATTTGCDGMVADRLSVGAPPDPLGPPGQDWGLPPLLPDALDGRRLRGVRRRPRGEHGARRRHPGRPRDGPVPAVRAAGRRARLGRHLHHLPGRRPAVGAGAREPPRALRGDRRGPRHRRGRRPRGAGRPRHPRLPAGVVRARARRSIVPRLAMAAVTTHDLPTVAGAYGGACGRPRPGARWRPWSAIATRPSRCTRTSRSSPALLACAALDDVLGAIGAAERARHRRRVPELARAAARAAGVDSGDPHAQAVLGAIRAGREEPGDARRTS